MVNSMVAYKKKNKSSPRTPEEYSDSEDGEDYGGKREGEEGQETSSLFQTNPYIP